ncbi:MAG: histidine--tRNA ligase [Gammaproteobacteria bacterium]|nr:histidine--tRNA ligase [Gammaproteobacteria bacterium]
MKQVLQAVRGMNDLLPEVLGFWHHVEAVARSVLHAYGYREIRLPIIERTELFARGVGEHTDIVEKEMYTFDDRNGDRLTLRPEGTAGTVRAGIEHGLLYNQVQRFWYMGPMFRHERPQKGRYRQFHQIGAEAFGMAGPDVDAELILLTARFWQALGLNDLTLEINTLGTPAARAAYRERLVQYLRAHTDQLDEDSQRRLESNPLRVLDSKSAATQEILKQAPNLLDHLDDESRAHFEQLRVLLDDAGLKYMVNSRLVRGLDYYTRTVFEWTTDRLGAQATVCAGGRYDGLVELMGGKPTPGFGFALGVERLIELLIQSGVQVPSDAPQIYVARLETAPVADALRLAEGLRNRGLRVACHCGDSSLKSQLKQADKSGARYVLLLEAPDRVVVKDLRGSGDGQQTFAPAQVVDHLAMRFAQATI